VTAPGPAQLWREAGGGTDHYDPERYKALMHQHGHLLRPGDDGYEQGSRDLPCGWPGGQRTAGPEGEQP
jgi:hypothetical protein